MGVPGLPCLGFAYGKDHGIRGLTLAFPGFWKLAYTTMKLGHASYRSNYHHLNTKKRNKKNRSNNRQKELEQPFQNTPSETSTIRENARNYWGVWP